ncbi:MAG TPA: TonB-dependent receptor plug domain-containing protein, partial [Gallionella sp.]|nr:TonB-dependent receptor plug domain-containing protein [Gallionella sp.]
MKLRRITVCVALAFSPVAFAEDPVTLPEVKVTAEKLQPLPSSNTVGLDQNGLARQRANTSDAARMLEGQPGVSMYGAGGVSSLPVVHGMADDRVRVKLDGMDLIPACPNHMNSPLSYIDPSSVSKVKVFAGIAPVSMGGDSIGGSIVVDSAMPEFAQTGAAPLAKGEVGAFFRSNGNGKGANVAATLANEHQNLSYTASTAFSGNYHAGGNFKAASAAATDKLTLWVPGDVVASTRYKSEN